MEQKETETQPTASKVTLHPGASRSLYKDIYRINAGIMVIPVFSFLMKSIICWSIFVKSSGILAADSTSFYHNEGE